MRIVRIIVAVLLAASLAIPPITTAMAMTSAAKAEMSMVTSGSDCPCCNAAKKCAADLCQFKCFHTLAISVEGLPLAEPLPEPLVAVYAASFSPVTLRPDPPPPRS